MITARRSSALLDVLGVLFMLVGASWACTSFYCVNKCGASSLSRGYKLIVANNRDENVYRPTVSATRWPTGAYPYPNVSVYGALDTLNGAAPDYYSTWLAISERGDFGNLLFFMQAGAPAKDAPRGVLVPNYLRAPWYGASDYMRAVDSVKNLYSGFNLLLAERNKTSGAYSLYYTNNNSSMPYEKLNANETTSFQFGISNSDPQRPFQKVIFGTEKFKGIIGDFAQRPVKDQLIEDLIDGLLQNKTPYYPDATLAAFMNRTAPQYADQVRNLSSIKADYTTYWKDARTRTSTVLLVDYDDNVEYYEFNLTTPNSSNEPSWSMNMFSFKLTPLY